MLVPMDAAAQAAQPPTTQACVVAYVRGQRERDAGKLVDARRDFLRCSQSDCPAVTSRDCDRWREDVESRVPTVVLEYRDASGRARTDVSVSVDGSQLVSTLDGRAVMVDPGRHTFTFSPVGEAPADREVVVFEGVKARLVAVSLVPPPPVAATPVGPPAGLVTERPVEASRPVPPLVWALGAVAVLGGAGFAFFGATGLSAENDLRSKCVVQCTQDEVAGGKSSIHAKYAAADVSLGVGVVALGAAAWLYFTRPQVRRPAAASVDLLAAPGGVVASWAGSF
jgi:hypothetical protein